MKYATLGPILTGTLISEELIDSFCDELEYQISKQSDPDDNEILQGCWAALAQCREECWDDQGYFFAHDDDQEYVNMLIDALNQFAAPRCYFGSHCGDAADFGYWPSWAAHDPDLAREGLFSPHHAGD